MTNQLNTHKLLNHLQTRIDMISNLAEADKYFEEAEKELRVLREEVLAGKFDISIWE